MPEGAGVGPRVSQTPFSSLSLGVPGEPLCCQQGFREFPFHCHGHSGWHFLSSQGQPGPIQAVQAPGCSCVCSQHSEMGPLWLVLREFSQRRRTPAGDFLSAALSSAAHLIGPPGLSLQAFRKHSSAALAGSSGADGLGPPCSQRTTAVGHAAGGMGLPLRGRCCAQNWLAGGSYYLEGGGRREGPAPHSAMTRGGGLGQGRRQASPAGTGAAAATAEKVG